MNSNSESSFRWSNSENRIPEGCRPVDPDSHDVLVETADEFLKNKGLSMERRAAVIEEMWLLRTGRFDTLYLPEGPVLEGKLHVCSERGLFRSVLPCMIGTNAAQQ